MATTDKGEVFVIRPEDRKNGWAVAKRCKEYLRDQCARLNPESLGIEVVVKTHRKNRSLAQNRLYWLWLKTIADHINASQGTTFSDEDIHEYMKEKFLESEVKEIAGDHIRIRKSTRTLTTKEMTDYLEQIEWYATENLSCSLPHPDAIFWEAMGMDK